MKYTCYKIITTKIYEGILEDGEEIGAVLKLLKEKELTFAMRVKKTPLYEKARLLKIDGDKITWRITQDGASLQKTSFIDDIDTIEVYADTESVMNLKPNPSRWSTLDPSSN